MTLDIADIEKDKSDTDIKTNNYNNQFDNNQKSTAVLYKCSNCRLFIHPINDFI